MSPSHWNLLKRYAQSYTVEWRRDEKYLDWILMVGDYIWRDLEASINRETIVKKLIEKKWPF